MIVCLARLHFHLVEVDRTGVDADRSSSFHSLTADSVFGDGIGQKVCCGLGATSAGNLLLTYVHQAIEEGAGGDDYGFCIEGSAPEGGQAFYFSVFNDDFGSFVLPDMKKNTDLTA